MYRIRVHLATGKSLNVYTNEGTDDECACAFLAQHLHLHNYVEVSSTKNEWRSLYLFAANVCFIEPRPY